MVVGSGTIDLVSVTRVPAPSPEERSSWLPWRSSSRWGRSWRWIRYLVGLGVAGLALWAVLGQRGELAGLSSALHHLQLWWVALALLAEAGSYLSFATAQRSLLRVAGVDVGFGPMTEIVVVATTITNSLPAGSVLATVFSFRQFRRRGADDAVAAWALLAVLVAAGASLALLAGVGLGLAGSEGASADLVGVTVGVVVLAVAGGVTLVQRRAALWVVAAASRALPEQLSRPIAAGLDRLSSVNLSTRQMLRAVWWTGGNWFLDCACLALSFLAVGSAVPWHGLLLAYGAGQLAANLPITPGGLGVVEGSMTIALVALGGDVASTAVVVLVYRVMSYWLELPIGWAVWGHLTWRDKQDARAAMPGAEKPGAGDLTAVTR